MGDENEAKRDSFLLHIEDFEDLCDLKDSDAGKLLRAIISYATGQEIPKLGTQAKTMFGYIRRHMERDTAKYQETCRKRAEAGKKGGRPKKANDNSENQELIPEKQTKAKKANGFFEKQTKAKKPDTDPDPDPDTDIDPDYDPDCVPPSGEGPGSGVNSGLLSESERKEKIRQLETFCRLYESGALSDKYDYAHWKSELRKLKEQLNEK